MASATKKATLLQNDTVKAFQSGLARTRDTASEELDELLGSLSEKVSDVRSALASATEDGLETLQAEAGTLVKKARKGVRSLDKRWQKMSRGQKVAVAGGLLAVLAAAAATPTLVRKAKASR
jgi:ElaB/YqjD/DUF883 family membrane-anchored ribosome-binding protein